MAKRKVEIIRYPLWTIKLTYTGWAAALAEGDRAFTRLFRRVLKSGLQKVVEYWYFRLFKRHFKKGAAERYGYEKRSPGYERLKHKLEGRLIRHWMKQPVRPFWVARNQPRGAVLSGTAERMATRSGVRLSGTSKKATGSITVPAYVMTRANIKNMPAELTATTQREADQMARILDRHIQEHMDAV